MDIEAEFRKILACSDSERRPREPSMDGDTGLFCQTPPEEINISMHQMKSIATTTTTTTRTPCYYHHYHFKLLARCRKRITPNAYPSPATRSRYIQFVPPRLAICYHHPMTSVHVVRFHRPQRRAANQRLPQIASDLMPEERPSSQRLPTAATPSSAMLKMVAVHLVRCCSVALFAWLKSRSNSNAAWWS
ncbi:hypothetical protein TgHK011_004636 [Trichoderma gracile]|nr:hypothetical protein TgHK011_004636 [Trichoderma gracile]